VCLFFQKIPEEFRQHLTKQVSQTDTSENGMITESFVVNDDHLVVRELAAKAIARMLMGDPSHLRSILPFSSNGGDGGGGLTRLSKSGGLDDDTREAVVDLFRESAVKVHKPLILHQGGGVVIVL
jgi:hypothetical protein